MPIDSRGIMENRLEAKPLARFVRVPRRESTPVESLSAIPAIGAGLLLGITDDPIAGTVLRKLQENFDLPLDILERLDQQTRGSTPAKIARVIGNIAPLLIGGVGAASAGAKIGSGLLRAGGKANLLGSRIGKAMKARELDTVESLIGTVKPGIERGAEFAGRNLGFGAFAGAESLASGESPEDALKEAAFAAAVGGAIEGTLVGAGKLLTGRARGINQDAVAARFKEGTFAAEPAARSAASKKLADNVTKILKTNEQIAEFNRGGLTQSLIEFRPVRDPISGKVTQARRGAATRRKLEDLRVKLAKEETAERALRGAEKELAVFTYTQDKPFNPGKAREVLNTLGRKFTTAPEAMFGMFGVLGAKVFSRLVKGHDTATINTLTTDVLVDKMAVQAAKGLGISLREIMGFKPSKALLNASHEWEKAGGGEAALRNYVVKSLGRTQEQADDVISAFIEHGALLEANNIRDQTVGGLGAIDMQRMRVGKFLHHMSEDMTETEMKERLALGGKSPVEVARIIDEAFNSGEFISPLERAAQRQEAAFSKARTGPSDRLGKVGVIDMRRSLPGTLKDKVELGYPVLPSMFASTKKALGLSELRFQYAEAIGPRGEVVEKAINAMKELGPVEGGNHVIFKDVVAGIVGQNYYSKAMRDTSKVITNLQMASKLPMAVLANLTQPGNTVVVNGLANTFKGYMARMRIISGGPIPKPEEVSQLVGANNGMVKLWNQAFDESGPVVGAAQTFGRFVMTASGFSGVEKLNRSGAGFATHFMVRDTLAKAMTGRLRGNSLDKARRSMRDVGIDLGDVTRKLKSQGDDYFRSAEWAGIGVPGDFGYQPGLEAAALFRGSQLSQFGSSKLRRPTAWDSPMGRVLSQFKTFAVSQTRLLRDQVLAEAALGNMTPLATFLSISPIAGEFVLGSRSLLTRTPRRDDDEGNLILRTFDTMMAYGGLGIATDMVTSARFGGVIELGLGPTVSDANRFTNSFINLEFGDILKQVQQQPLARATTGLLLNSAMTLEAAVNYLDELDREETPITLEEFRQSEKPTQ